jgi:hypothetical protein
MSQYDKWLLIALAVFYFPTFGLFCFMILRVNRKLPAPGRFRFSIMPWGDWTRLSRPDWTELPTEHRRLYPRSILYRLAVSGAITLLVIAVAFFALRWWEYANRIP